MDLLDAALLKQAGRYYLYYIVRYENRRALTCAVSEDGFSFIKTGLDVEIPGVDTQKLSSVSVLDGEAPRLYFVAGGEAYYAESIDLLHFEAPVPLKLSAVDKVIPFAKNDLYARKEGKLFRVENGALSLVENAPALAHPVIYREELLYFGIEEGAFAYRKA